MNMFVKIVYQSVILFHLLIVTRAQYDCVPDSMLGNRRAAGTRGEDNIPNGNTDSTVIILDTGAGSTASPPEGEISYTSTCCGKITSWNVDPQKVLGPVESMKLQIWRPESGDSYYLVGEELYTNTNGFASVVPSTVDILIQAGDKLGFTGHELEYKKSLGYNKDLAGRVLREDALNPTVGGSYTLPTEHPDADDHITPEMIGFAFHATLTERDNPECSINITAASFAEDSPVGTLIATISTTTFPDATIPKYTFSLSDSGGLNITVDADSGEVRTTGNLTAMPPSSTFTMTGRTTEAICLKYGECQGNVTINWINQPIQITNVPITKSLTDSVDAGTIIYTIATQDSDRNRNVDTRPTCIVLTTVPPGGPFSISSNADSTKFDLNFDNSSALDAASIPTYLVTIKCTDEYGLFDTGTVTLNITKNTAPSVTNTTDANGKICQEVDAAVTKKFDSVLTLGIQDAESDTIYSAFTKSDSSSPFDWNSTTFEVFATEDLLPLQTEYHEFSLQIWDKWSSRISHTLCVTIVGINSPPYFSLCPTNISIPETQGLGDVICTVAATDVNKMKDNQTHTFTLVKAEPASFKSQFTVDNPSGDIALAGSGIDYETSYRDINGSCIILELSVTDGITASPINCEICVTILDMNEPPVFQQKHYNYTMKEEETVPALIPALRFPFTDPDMSDIHTYNIIGGDTSGYFSINSQTGILSLVKICDLEENCPSSFTLVLEIDDGTLQDQATVDIMVADINDNAPVFTIPSYSIKVSDATLLTETLLTVTASDKDSGVNKDITYWVKGSGILSQYYTVDVNGRLKLKKKLDHTNATQYTISVCARDQGVPFQFGCTNIDVTFVRYTSDLTKSRSCFLCTPKGVSLFAALITVGVVLVGACMYLSIRKCILPYKTSIRWPRGNPQQRQQRTINNLNPGRQVWNRFGTTRTFPMPPAYRT